MALPKKTKPRTVKVYPFVPVEILTWAKKEVTRRRRKNVHDDSTAQGVLAELLIGAHAIATTPNRNEVLATCARLRRAFPPETSGPLAVPASQSEAL